MKYLTHHLLQSSARQRPDKEAIVFGSVRFDYASVWRQVCGLADGLRNAGVRRGDRVGILLSPCPEQSIAIFGTAAAAAVFVPIHHSWSAKQVAHVVNDCGVKCLITNGKVWSSLDSDDQQLPSLETVVLIDQRELESKRTIVDYRTCVDSGRDDVVDSGIGKDLAAILYTSGSTGLPKGVMLSHANLLAGTDIVASYLELEESDRIFSVLPFTFDAGLNQLTTAFGCGATMVMTKSLFQSEVCNTLIAERITGLAGVPTFWGLLAQNKTFNDTEFPDLRYVTNTGGAMPLSVLETLRNRLPNTRVFLMYGLTEAFRSTYLDPARIDEHPTSIGKAIPDTEILVINEAGEECAPGEVGELVHDGPTVSLGYWERPELNAKVFRPHPLNPPGRSQDNRVCYSGDLVHKNEDGFLFFAGRRDNQIKTSGYRVSRREIEDSLLANELVISAAVVGIPDSLLGQRVIAFVVPTKSKDFNRDTALAGCAKSLPAYMVPKSCIVLDAMPVTSSGKVNYPELQRLAEANTAS